MSKCPQHCLNNYLITRVENAIFGKSYSNGGLNIPDIVALLKSSGQLVCTSKINNRDYLEKLLRRVKCLDSVSCSSLASNDDFI